MKRTRTVLGSVGMLVFAGLTMAACGAADGGAAGDDPVGVDGDQGVVVTALEKVVAPLARISKNGVNLEFYEGEPGDVIVLESGPNGKASLVSDALKKTNLSPAALYKAVAGAAAPPALAAAEQRWSAAQKAGPPAGQLANEPKPSQSSTSDSSALQASGDDLGSSSQAINAAPNCDGRAYDDWFKCSFCFNGADFGINWMYSSGNQSYTRNDVNNTASTVSVYGGTSVRLTMSVRKFSSWDTPYSARVQNGYWAQYKRTGDVLDYDTRGVVDQAAGTSYHWCAWGY